jgi:hypothetical protein
MTAEWKSFGTCTPRPLPGPSCILRGRRRRRGRVTVTGKPRSCHSLPALPTARAPAVAAAPAAQLSCTARASEPLISAVTRTCPTDPGAAVYQIMTRRGMSYSAWQRLVMAAVSDAAGWDLWLQALRCGSPQRLRPAPRREVGSRSLSGGLAEPLQTLLRLWAPRRGRRPRRTHAAPRGRYGVAAPASGTRRRGGCRDQARRRSGQPLLAASHATKETVMARPLREGAEVSLQCHHRILEINRLRVIARWAGSDGAL